MENHQAHDAPPPPPAQPNHPVTDAIGTTSPVDVSSSQQQQSTTSDALRAAAQPEWNSYLRYRFNYHQWMLWYFHMHYHQQMASGQPPRPPSASPIPPMIPAAVANEVQQQPGAPAANPPNNGQQGNDNDNVVMNAQGGAMLDDDEGRERDVIDYIYLGFRLAMLLFIMFFYASAGRIGLLLVGIAVIQAFRNRFYNNRQHNAQQNNPPPVVPEPPVNDPQPRRRRNDESSDVDSTTDEDAAVAEAQAEGNVEAPAHPEQPNIADPEIPAYQHYVERSMQFILGFVQSLFPEDVGAI